MWSSMTMAYAGLDDAPSGIGEIVVGDAFISYAIDRTESFAAVRLDARTLEGALLRHEAFFVAPKQNGVFTKAKVGGRTVVGAQINVSTVKPFWLEAIQSVSDGEVDMSALKVPSFMDLAAILSSRGQVVIANSDLQADLSDRSYELDYFKQLSMEQADELRQVRAVLRSMTEVMTQQGTINSLDAVVQEQLSDRYAEAEDLDWLLSWSEENTERIHVCSRAFQGAKKSLYRQPKHVYDALELLAGPYRDMRNGLISREALREAVGACGVQLRGSTTVTTAGSQGEAYFVNYKGKRRMLDMHLVRGGGRDEQYCMRIYFFWDEEDKKAVVGWLPSHLANSLT